ncbi:dihydrofolate reductase [Halorubrum sp. JWXQ-INN 858]|uniref:dihydrofolate reductase n=1 Tax=Halorubrum sp. JWXQ-INN 858 TaxID=2690782 RepID=UPI0013567803|nr:dihydrofolate reductase [Halorubrum sp. JWXQ-INN 858]MWV64692.1 dihydrofolate reductase [Halorubrum sp. JWXQ-INN 858]
MTGTNADADAGTNADGDVEFVLVAAVAANRVIGADDGMPWHYPADLRHFKRLTVDHPVIVGRTTYESIADRIGGPLPDRTSIVLTTRDLDLPTGAVVAHDVEAAIERARANAVDRGVSTVYVIGGATVYEAFLNVADRMVITEIPDSPDGDTRFPAWDPTEWVETDRQVEGDLAFVTYVRAEN